MHSSKKIDMTRGPIMKLVVLFALPICFGNILQQLYNTVDTLVIGNFCNSVSLAAVGTSAQPVEVFLCIFLGIGTGVSILVSQYTGSGDTKSLNRLVDTASVFVFLCSVPLTIAGIFLGPLILRFMQTPLDAWDLSVAYLRIFFLGTLGNMGYNMNAGILRGVGDSRASLLFLLVSCLMNIVLDVVFVAGFSKDAARRRIFFHFSVKKYASIHSIPKVKLMGKQAIIYFPSIKCPISQALGIRTTHSMTILTMVEYFTSPIPFTKEIIPLKTAKVQREGTTTLI